MPEKPNRRSKPEVSHQTVIVLNPVEGGSRYARPELARKWVRCGHARWADESHSRVILSADARVRMAGFAFRERRDQQISYDEILRRPSAERPPLTIRELAAIPIANPKKLLGVGRSRRKGAAVVA